MVFFSVLWDYIGYVVVLETRVQLACCYAVHIAILLLGLCNNFLYAWLWFCCTEYTRCDNINPTCTTHLILDGLLTLPFINSAHFTLWVDMQPKLAYEESCQNILGWVLTRFMTHYLTRFVPSRFGLGWVLTCLLSWPIMACPNFTLPTQLPPLEYTQAKEITK